MHFGTFESWYKKQVKEQLAFPKQVSYFHGCYVNYNYPQLGKDLVKVRMPSDRVWLIEKKNVAGGADFEWILSNKHRKQADINIGSIRKSVVDKNIPVIATSSTCTLRFRDEYPHLLGVKNEDVREQVELATRYIYRLLSQETGQLEFRKDKKLRVAYPTPCHMEKLGWAYYSIELLKSIPNVELVLLDSQCCGIAGTYDFKKEN